MTVLLASRPTVSVITVAQTPRGPAGEGRMTRGYASAMQKRRLDTVLAERGLFPSRSRAAAAVLAGEVRVGGEGGRPAKPGQLVQDDVAIDLEARPDFVSRGGIKLANALNAFGIDPAGSHGLDVGAADGRIHRLPAPARCDGGGSAGRRLRRARLEASPGPARDGDRAPERPSSTAGRAAVRVPTSWPSDVSFISLGKVLPAVLACAAPEFDCLALVKPQFEVGRERVGKGGVVRDADVRRGALVAVGEAASATGWAWPCWDSRRRAFQGPPVTAKASSGWREAGRDGGG